MHVRIFDLPNNIYASFPDVFSLHRRHMHIQVTHVGLLWIDLQTLLYPVLLRTRQEWVGYKDKPYVPTVTI